MSVIRKFLQGNKMHTHLFRSLCTSPKVNSASDFILHCDLPDAELPKVSIDEFVLSKADNWANFTATECAISGRKYTFDDLRIKATNLNKALRKKLKLQKSDVIAVLLPNCPEFALVVLGSLKAGLVLTTINPIYTPDEISRQLKDSKAKAIITLNVLSPLAQKSLEIIKTNIPILSIQTEKGQSTPKGCINFSEFTEPIDFVEAEPAQHDDIAFLPYSSGTTGLPKGVQLTHHNIVSNVIQFGVKGIQVVEKTTKDHQDVVPAVLPMFHIYGLTVTVLNLLRTGSKTVAIPKFEPALYLETLRKHKPDVLFVAPPLILFLTCHPMVKSSDLASIRVTTSGAAPLGSLDEERFLHKAQKHIKVLQGYGLTETSPVIAMTRVNSNEPGNGSVGLLVPNTIAKVVDPDDPKDTPLGPNQVGEILVKGPQVMKGYLNRPEENKKIFTQDGWLRTGDMVQYNEQKMFFISDRLKELIKVKGFQVAPAELEELIRDFPNVDDCAVIGIPHPTQGESPRAYIVPKKGTVVDTDKLNDFVAEKVAEYKRLRGGIQIVDSIPKNTTGKILRRHLKEAFLSKKV